MFNRLRMKKVLKSYLNHHNVSENHAKRLKSITALMENAGINANNINAERLNLLLASLQGKFSTQTLITKRQLLLCLWKHGVSSGLVKPSVSFQVIKIRTKRKPVKAYSRDQIIESYRNLQEKSENFFGNFRKSKCSRKLWLMAWYRVAYESGLRFGDIYHLRDIDITSAGIAITMNKTGKPAVRKLHPETRELIDRLLALSPDGTVFSWAIGKSMACTWTGKAFKQLGLKHGHNQWMRRSAATHIEQDNPGMASRFLGHANPMMAERHYIDQSQLMDNMPSPPEWD